MKGALCTRPGTFELREIETPSPAPGDVVVRVRSCGICGSDLHYFNGAFRLPSVCPGHEISGEVAAVGPNVAARVGDRVALEPRSVCRECWCCRTGNLQVCAAARFLGDADHGGFAEYVRIPEYALVPVPPAVDFEVAALAEPMAVAVHAARVAQVALGDRVVVLGAGTIGLLAVVAAKTAGAGEVWCTARHPHQRAAAESLGASKVFLGPEARRQLQAAARQQVVDAVIETVGGAADTIAEAVEVVRPQGAIAVLGVFTVMPAFNALALIAKEVRMFGSATYGRVGARTDFELAVRLLGEQPERFRPLLTHRVPLSEIARGFETAINKRSGSIKVLIQPA
ncbi:MAG: butanediol dehydrogenase [Deltaproteobacteria bacterium]|nr:butanediol dehydrogenase [Deltaproteobacteria bacterium]